MTLTIDLTPEEEARLTEQARAAGQEVGVFVRHWINDLPVAGELPLYLTATEEEFEALMDELAEGSEHLLILPPEAYTCESIYGDHD